MKSLRLWIAVGAVWVIVAFTAAREALAGGPPTWITLAAAISGAAACVVVTSRATSRLAAALVPCFAYVGLDFVLVGALVPDAAAAARLESVVAGTTLSLAALAMGTLETMRRSLHDVFVSVDGANVRPFAYGQEELYREFRRARAYQRPLTLLALTCRSGTRVADADRFVREIHQQLVDRAALEQIAGLLARRAPNCEVVVRYGRVLVGALPATPCDEAAEIAIHVAAQCEAREGLVLRWGCATFPDDGLTFESVLHRALVDLDHAADVRVDGRDGGRRPRLDDRADGAVATTHTTAAGSGASLTAPEATAAGNGSRRPASVHAMPQPVQRDGARGAPGPAVRNASGPGPRSAAGSAQRGAAPRPAARDAPTPGTRVP